MPYLGRASLLFALAACGSSSPDPGTADAPPVATVDAPPPGTPDAQPADVVPDLTLCRIADPAALGAVFDAHPAGDAMTYTCSEVCTDGVACAVDFLGQGGTPVMSARGGRMQVIDFVVDGMAGHLVFTPDGDDAVVTHGGVGGTGMYHSEFDGELQANSTLRTVSLGWEHGATIPGFGGAGWLTRKDAAGSSMRALTVRPAAAIAWVKRELAPTSKLGTVGASFGTIATFGPHAWWGLDSILDYQMLIGGPPLWDVNVGCGRDHVAAGHCDLDVSPCTGNPNSDYGNDDPACDSPGTTNQCRVPTVMAELPDGSSEFDHAINYIHATTACAPAATRDPSLDASSLGSTVTDWSFRGPVDFVSQEGAPQPPQSDQGMGEGHAMYVFTAIQTEKRWIDDDGHHHGDAWQKDPALVADTAAIVAAAMEQ